MPTILLRVLLALSLISIAASAEAQDAAAAPAEAPATLPAPAPAPAEAAAASEVATTRVPRVQTLSLGFSWMGQFFHAENGDNYRFQSPAVSFDYFVGRRWGFAFHLNFGVPIVGGQTGSNEFHGSLSSKYASARNATDTTFMAARRMPITDKLTFMYGFGFNFTTIRLLGEDYLAIELMAGGIGAQARVEYQLTKLLFVAGQLNFAVDPIDFIRHQNRVTMTNPLTGSLSLGLKF